MQILEKSARVQGIESIQSDIDKEPDHFLKISLQLLVDKVKLAELERVLSDNIQYIRKRHALGRAFLFFETAGKYAPAFGLFGTVVGLIKSLADLSSRHVMEYQRNIMVRRYYHNMSVSQSCLRSFLCNPYISFQIS